MRKKKKNHVNELKILNVVVSYDLCEMISEITHSR